MCGITTALAGLGVLVLTRRRYLPAAILVLLLLTTDGYISAFTSVSTESLFLPLVAGSLACLAVYLARNRVGLLVLFIALAAASTLARSVGVALVATGVIAVAVWSSGRRVVRALIVGATGLAPLLAWTAWESRRDLGGAGDIAYHRPPLLDNLARTLTGWLTGRHFAGWSDLAQTAVFVAVVGLIVVAGWALRGTFRAPLELSIVRVCWLFPAGYIHPLP
jgi:hypothetical protein